jgi:hypothetical protein
MACSRMGPDRHTRTVAYRDFMCRAALKQRRVMAPSLQGSSGRVRRLPPCLDGPRRSSPVVLVPPVDNFELVGLSDERYCDPPARWPERAKAGTPHSSLVVDLRIDGDVNSNGPVEVKGSVSVVR